MEELVGLRVRKGDQRGLISEASGDSLLISWTGISQLRPLVESVPLQQLVSRPMYRDLEVLTLTEGWQPMRDQFDIERSRSLVEDLESLLAEVDAADELSEDVEEEGEPLSEAKGGGKAAEKAAREKRRGKKIKRLGSGRNPFKTKEHLGPGPRGGTNTKTDQWKCSCKTPYKCLCRSGKRKKTIKISKPYKDAYNHHYKAWRASQRY